MTKITKSLNSIIVNDMVRSIGGSFKSKLYKIILSAAALSAIVYILSKVIKSSSIKGINTKPKTEEEEINDIYKASEFSPEHIVRIPKKDYDRMRSSISISVYGGRMMSELDSYSKRISSGDVFISSEKAFEIYSKSMLTFGFIKDHKMSNCEMDKFFYISSKNEMLSEVKNKQGEDCIPAPGTQDGSIVISKDNLLKFMTGRAINACGKKSTLLAVSKDGFERFKTIVTKDRLDCINSGGSEEDLKKLDYNTIGKADSKVFIAYKQGALTDYKWLTRDAIEINDEENSTITLSKEDYKKLIDKVESCEFKNILMPLLKKYASIDDSDNVLFTGDKAISVLCKALVSSKRVEHQFAGWHPNNLLHINVHHKLFDSLKEFGSPVELMEDEYIINANSVKDTVKKKALEHYKEGAEWAWFDEVHFNNFKKHASEGSDFIFVKEFDDSFFVALPPGSKEKFPKVNVYPAKIEEKAEK